MYLPPPAETYELPPAGTHMAICYRILDLGTQDGSFNGQANRQHKILVSWEMPDEKMDDGRPFTISQRYTWSMSDKAALRRDLESWRGLPFSEKDFGPAGFDIKNILNKACLLNVVHTEKNGKHYANIASIAKLMKGMNAPPATNEIAYLWLTLDRWSAEVFYKLSQGLQQVIMRSPEYQELVTALDAPTTVGPVSEATEFYSDPIPF